MQEESQDVAQQLALQVREHLPRILRDLVQTGFHPEDRPVRLQCYLTAAESIFVNGDNHVPIASVDISGNFTSITSAETPRDGRFIGGLEASLTSTGEANHLAWHQKAVSARQAPIPTPDDGDFRPNKRKKTRSARESQSSTNLVRHHEGRGEVIQEARRVSGNPTLQPSSLEKFINGVWDSLFSGVRMDPTEIIEQWQAIESSGQPQLLTDNEQDVAVRGELGAFGRMNVLTRKISQTSKACRSLEVIVQAYWVQCFDDRVSELAETLSRDKAKKSAIAEACVDFNWTEKELRNKMAIWRGYHDIKNAAGWVALCFSSLGLYRFCKYRVSFTNETFQTLKNLRHRFEVAADTLHPRWRVLLGIVGARTEPKYKGHLHDWVVNGPENEAIPLRQTYSRWDPNFSYIHLDQSTIDEDAWGDFDPRTVIPESDPESHKCQNCGEQQSNDPTQNSCRCYPNLYGSPKASAAPLQVFRTSNGKNNGLMACCAFEKGWAVGEFIGEITTGIKGLDVMVDQTDRAVGRTNTLKLLSKLRYSA